MKNRKGEAAEPTCVSLVWEVLRARNEFTDITLLHRMTGSARNAISAALHHLRKHRAVDVVVENDGTGWWFATPDTDTRLRAHDLRVIEQKPRKLRHYAPGAHPGRKGTKIS